MGFLSNAVAQMIATMEPAERQEAILSVTGQALTLMDSADRLALTRQLLVALIDGLTPAERAQLLADLTSVLTRGR
ncbi:MAG: hypothetical protein IT340_15365 [Chloroflexi bacterium]|nr:hypothetical protein [Chloroflexota bacterium]